MYFYIWLFWFCGSRVSSVRNHVCRLPAELILWKVSQLFQGHVLYCLMYDLTQSRPNLLLMISCNSSPCFYCPLSLSLTRSCIFAFLETACVGLCMFQAAEKGLKVLCYFSIPSCCLPYWVKYFTGGDVTKKSSVLPSLWDRTSLFEVLQWSVSGG